MKVMQKRIDYAALIVDAFDGKIKTMLLKIIRKNKQFIGE